MSLTEIPNVETPDTSQAQELGTQIIGVLIATAIVIFLWRMLNGTARTIVIVLLLAFFVIGFVVPNWGGQ